MRRIQPLPLYLRSITCSACPSGNQRHPVTVWTQSIEVGHVSLSSAMRPLPRTRTPSHLRSEETASKRCGTGIERTYRNGSAFKKTVDQYLELERKSSANLRPYPVDTEMIARVSPIRCLFVATRRSIRHWQQAGALKPSVRYNARRSFISARYQCHEEGTREAAWLTVRRCLP